MLETTTETPPPATTTPVEPAESKQEGGLDKRIKALEEIADRFAKKAKTEEEARTRAEYERDQALRAASETKANALLSGLGLDPELAELLVPKILASKDAEAEAKRLAAKFTRPTQVHLAPSSTASPDPSHPRDALSSALKKVWS